MSSVNSFTSSFLIRIPFISFFFFFFLNALSGTSSRMLNRSGKDRHLYLVSDKETRGKAFSLSSLSVTLVVGMLYQAEEVAFCS